MAEPAEGPSHIFLLLGHRGKLKLGQRFTRNLQVEESVNTELVNIQYRSLLKRISSEILRLRIVLIRFIQ